MAVLIREIQLAAGANYFRVGYHAASCVVAFTPQALCVGSNGFCCSRHNKEAPCSNIKRITFRIRGAGPRVSSPCSTSQHHAQLVPPTPTPLHPLPPSTLSHRDSIARCFTCAGGAGSSGVPVLAPGACAGQRHRTKDGLW